MAHRWDEASGSKLTAGMADATGTNTDSCSNILGKCIFYTRKEEGLGPRPEARRYYHNPYEEFAESVTVTVYPHAADINPAFGGSRYTFVREQFKDYRANETS